MKSHRLLYVINLVVVLAMLWLALPTVVQSAASATPTTTKAKAGGAITLSSSSGKVGDYVEVTGVDFINDGSISTILFGSTTVTTDNEEIDEGEFETHFIVPSLPKAAYTVKVTSNAGDSASATFTIQPRITLDDYRGRAGDQIVVSGDGFVASAKISVYFDHSTTTLCTGSASASGILSGLAVTVPASYAGEHVISVSDTAGNSVSDEYTINPIITVDPVTLSPGADAYVSGSGFAPSSQITIEIDNVLITNYVNTENSGILNKTRIKIPSISAGNHIIAATDVEHNFAEFNVNASCSIIVTPKSGLIGSQITITGAGFLPSTNITLDYYGINPLNGTRVNSDSEGSFSVTFITPNTPAGTYHITARDGLNSSSCQFISTASSGLEVNSGVVGADIPVNGTGFTAGATMSIKFDGIAIAKTNIDASGSFSTTFKVPARSGGLHKIILTDGINPISYNFTILPTAQISNSDGSGTQITGFLGSNINVSGNAFTPGAEVSIRYDSKEVAAPIVNADGTFSDDFAAPAGRPGKHTVIASEGNNKFTFTFIMESNPPAVPMPIGPIKDSQNEGLPKFQWSSVVDPSGVTYFLQVAAEPSFSAPVIQKTDLNVNTYQLTEDELLVSSKKNQPYYWRVKAIDGIFNESQWSPAYTFNVGHPLPVWIWYVTAGAILILILVGGYIAGKKWPEAVPAMVGKVKTIRIPIPKFKKKE